MFRVLQGVTAHAIKSGQEWYDHNFKTITTSKTSIFEKEEVVVDPVGKLGANRSNPKTVGGGYAREGYYGFERDGWIILVHGQFVEYLD